MSNIYAERNIKSKKYEWQSGFDFEPGSQIRTSIKETIVPCPDQEAVQTDLDYESLRRVLEAAYDQASIGKGKERHAGDGLAFIDQPMQAISKLLNTSDGLAFQAIKKVTESQGMKTFEQKERELLGAIVYIAGMIIFEQDRPTI
jgi:hypothetical protein